MWRHRISIIVRLKGDLRLRRQINLAHRGAWPNSYAKRYNENFSKEALERILNELSQAHKEQQQKVEAFQLQVLCQYLESKVAERGQEGLVIQLADLPEAANIFEAYYNRQIGQLPEKERQAARLIIEEGLILEDPVSGEGRRLGVDGALLVQQFKDIGATPGLLLALENTFLLRRQANALGGVNFEVSHDSLLFPILRAKAARKEQEERLVQEQEEEAKQGKRAWSYIFNRTEQNITRTPRNVYLGRSCRCVKGSD